MHKLINQILSTLLTLIIVGLNLSLELILVEIET